MGYSPPPTPSPPSSSPLVCPVPSFAESTLLALQSTVETLICCRFFVSHLRGKPVPLSTTRASASKQPSLNCRGLESSLQYALRSIIVAASSSQEEPKASARSGSGLTECKLLIDFAVAPTNSATTVKDIGELRLLERWSLKLTIHPHMEHMNQSDSRGGCAVLSAEEREIALAVRNIVEESASHPAVKFLEGATHDAFDLKSYTSFRIGGEGGGGHCLGKICDQNGQSLFFIIRNVDTNKSSHSPHDLSFDGTYTEDKLRPIKLRSSTIVPVVFYLGQPGRVDTLSPVTEEYLRSEEPFYESLLGGSVLPSHTMLLGYEATRSSGYQAGQEEDRVSQGNMSLLTRLLHTSQKYEDRSQDFDQLMQSLSHEKYDEPMAMNADEQTANIDYAEDGDQKLMRDGSENFILASLESPKSHSVSPLYPDLRVRYQQDMPPSKIYYNSLEPGRQCVLGTPEDISSAWSLLQRSSLGSEEYAGLRSELSFCSPSAFKDDDSCSIPSCASSLSTSSEISLLSSSPGVHQGSPAIDMRHHSADGTRRTLSINDVYGEREFSFRTKYRRTFHNSAGKEKFKTLPILRGSFEESLLSPLKSGSPTDDDIHGFQMHISLVPKVPKFTSPTKLTLPLKLHCFRDNDIPIHFGRVEIEESSYCETPRGEDERVTSADGASLMRRIRIPRVGCIHVVIVNPEGTPIQRIPIDYDMSDMPRGTKTFIRYKQFLKDGGTRVAFHFKIYSSRRSGRLYLYHEIRLFFSMTNVEGDFRELEKVTTYPVDPKYFSV